MNGTNWTSFGTHGSGTGQFISPQSISIDPAGRIWVLDNGNGRLIRMDDMNGPIGEVWAARALLSDSLRRCLRLLGLTRKGAFMSRTPGIAGLCALTI